MSRNAVTVTASELVVEPVGLTKLWSFTRRLRFPIEHVRGATSDPGVRREPKGRRGPGLRWGHTLSGTFHADGTKQFWNVSGYDDAVVITLEHTEDFDRLVLSVDDPQQVVDAVNAAC